MIELLSNPQAWIAFLTLTALELVLGIDNVIFISVLLSAASSSKVIMRWRSRSALAIGNSCQWAGKRTAEWS